MAPKPGPYPGVMPTKSNPSLSEEDALKVLDSCDEMITKLVKDVDIDEDAIREALVDYFIGTDTEENFYPKKTNLPATPIPR